MLKLLFLIHRYFGIGIGLIMLLWCLSGFVMMYKPYPRLSAEQAQAVLPPLNISNCCSLISSSSILEGTTYDFFQLEMLNKILVLHLYGVNGRLITVDLNNDRVFYEIAQDQAFAVASAYARQQGFIDFALMDVLHNDQWTVAGSYNRHRPLYQFKAEDAAGTQWYVSSRTGEIVQITTSQQRLWGYLGAVVHWVYPTLLRQNASLWNSIVVWLSIIGVFLTSTGIYFGLKQYKRRRNGRSSPYRGFSLWHHYTGLIFGLVTLTWVFSGLLSMNPWGLLEGSGARKEAAELQGGSTTWQEVNSLLSQLESFSIATNSVLLQGQKLQDELFLFSIDDQNKIVRYNAATGQTELLNETRLHELAKILLFQSKALSVEMMAEEDNYYYSLHDPVSLPVFKVVANNEEQTTYYLDPVNGEIIRKVDQESRWNRWLFSGLHSFDFTPVLRSRPIWDIVMWILLLGATMVCLTGFIMGLRRVSKLLKKQA